VARPVIRFQAPQIPPAREVETYFTLAEESGWYSNRGPCHELLVERLGRYLGPGVSCILIANATLGLTVTLRAMTGTAPRRREVLIPSFTFAAAVDAVLWAGLEPGSSCRCWRRQPRPRGGTRGRQTARDRATDVLLHSASPHACLRVEAGRRGPSPHT
jgi:DegT/DnrJ/EryC1/StrS aminotransferase family